MDPQDIEVKHLRWLAEIVCDGSEIKSLSGRAAKLGDGTSRNPSDRDQLLAQRTKDLEGLAGQVRGFDLDEFLSMWEEAGTAVPWAPGDQAWIGKDSAAQRVFHRGRATEFLGIINEVLR